jgi:hypothetical protein
VGVTRGDRVEVMGHEAATWWCAQHHARPARSPGASGTVTPRRCSPCRHLRQNPNRSSRRHRPNRGRGGTANSTPTGLGPRCRGPRAPTSGRTARCRTTLWAEAVEACRPPSRWDASDALANARPVQPPRVHLHQHVRRSVAEVIPAPHGPVSPSSTSAGPPARQPHQGTQTCTIPPGSTTASSRTSTRCRLLASTSSCIAAGESPSGAPAAGGGPRRLEPVERAYYQRRPRCATHRIRRGRFAPPVPGCASAG